MKKGSHASGQENGMMQRLKAAAATSEERPMVETIEPEVRTSKYAGFAKVDQSLLGEAAREQ